MTSSFPRDGMMRISPSTAMSSITIARNRLSVKSETNRLFMAYLIKSPFLFLLFYVIKDLLSAASMLAIFSCLAFIESALLHVIAGNDSLAGVC